MVSRGGHREGAGRKAVLSESKAELVARICIERIEAESLQKAYDAIDDLKDQIDPGRELEKHVGTLSLFKRKRWIKQDRFNNPHWEDQQDSLKEHLPETVREDGKPVGGFLVAQLKKPRGIMDDVFKNVSHDLSPIFGPELTPRVVETVYRKAVRARMRDFRV